MPRRLAAAAAGTDQPPATAAKIKTASHTNFLTLPRALRGVKLFARGGRLLIFQEVQRARHALRGVRLFARGGRLLIFPRSATCSTCSTWCKAFRSWWQVLDLPKKSNVLDVPYVV